MSQRHEFWLRCGAGGMKGQGYIIRVGSIHPTILRGTFGLEVWSRNRPAGVDAEASSSRMGIPCLSATDRAVDFRRPEVSRPWL